MRAQPIRLGFDTLTSRELFALSVETIDELGERIELPSASCVCLVAWDSTAASTETVRKLARVVISSGAAWVCTWGAGCDQVHLVVDLELIRDDPESVKPHVVTTSHGSESFESAVWFFLMCTCPDDAWADTCRSAVVLTIGQPDLAEVARMALSDPRGFSNRVVGDSAADAV